MELAALETYLAASTEEQRAARQLRREGVDPNLALAASVLNLPPDDGAPDPGPQRRMRVLCEVPETYATTLHAIGVRCA